MTLSIFQTSTHPSIRAITLIAHEETKALLGVSHRNDRPIGFASVFLSIENPVEDEYQLVVQSIEVIDAVTGSVLLCQTAPQTIHLMPLEHTTGDVHLTNQTGYAATQTVQAIAHYQVIQLSSSSPVLTSTIKSTVVAISK